MQDSRATEWTAFGNLWQLPIMFAARSYTAMRFKIAVRATFHAHTSKNDLGLGSLCCGEDYLPPIGIGTATTFSRVSQRLRQNFTAGSFV
jgi:hypothetical protein